MAKMPEIRRETGRGARLAEIGKRTQWQKGCPSPNPGGRPSRKRVTEAYEKLANVVVENDPKKRTYLELLAEGQFRSAIKGKTDAAREIADRLEGKVAQAVAGTDAGPVEVRIINHIARPEWDAVREERPTQTVAASPAALAENTGENTDGQPAQPPENQVTPEALPTPPETRVGGFMRLRRPRRFSIRPWER